ncbi:MAG: hypothetical protein HGA90_02060 [Alphaproteobacteria bacterium]|nr:hypothetical protein [Alphaproteobacteria bacterium]
MGTRRKLALQNAHRSNGDDFKTAHGFLQAAKKRRENDEAAHRAQELKQQKRRDDFLTAQAQAFGKRPVNTGKPQKVSATALSKCAITQGSDGMTHFDFTNAKRGEVVSILRHFESRQQRLTFGG